MRLERHSIVQEAEAIHRAWFELQAMASGGDVRQIGGVQTTRAGDRGMIAFPEASDSQEPGQLLDDLLGWLNGVGAGSALGSVGCWCAAVPPVRLSAALLARGFEWGWQPHWMGLDLSELQTMPRRDRAPVGVTIDINPDESIWDRHVHPSHGSSRSQNTCVPPYLSDKARARWDGSLWHAVAWMDSKPVGAGVAYQIGEVAGLFDIAVLEEYRRRGIGAAVTNALLELAQRHGCRRAVLNATPMGELLYRRLGFISAGWGQTYWLHRHVLQRMPLDPVTVAFAQAVGTADLGELEALVIEFGRDRLDETLPCGLRPVELAVQLGQVDSVEGLVAKGATLDVMSACNLGWREKVPRMLAERPELVNFRSGSERAGPLHWAAAQGDLELVEWLLAAGADPGMKDAVYGSTPAGWARHFGHVSVAEYIEKFGV